MPDLSPGLRVVTASRLEPLFERYAADAARARLGPFERETVVVARTNGLRTWIASELARTFGCAASLEMVSPRRFVDALAQRAGVVPRGLAGQAFEAESLAWRIATLLSDGALGAPVYRPLHDWLGAQTEAGDVAVAGRLARLYDDYQVYRPAMLAGWAEHRLAADGFEHQAWQADLWRRLRDTAADGETDRATALHALRDRLSDGLDGLDLPPVVSVFGAPLFPPAYLDVLVALSAHVGVTVYAAVPGDGQALDECGAGDASHPLLRDLGHATRDYGRVLVTAGRPPVESLDTVAASAPRPPAATALAALQHALDGDHPAALAPEAARLAGDGSLRVVDAHSPVREVEILRDHLLDAFDTLGDLRPEEVGVLVPDLDTYAPLVDAIFGDDGVGVRLPVHVADHPESPEARVLDAFTRMLALGSGRATASEVLGLLDVPVVRRAADIREAELALLHTWIGEARVHWGRDGDHKHAFGLDADDVHTWRFGLDRLVLGYAVGPVESAVLGRWPVAEASTDHADLLGRFAEWVEALFDRIDTLRADRTPQAWGAALMALADDAFAPRADAEMAAMIELRKTLARLGRVGDARTVSLPDVRAHLGDALGRVERHEPYLTGRITVGDPLMLRSVPFRVLAVVGLGDAYPRTERRPAFDQIAHAPQPGDPDPHGTDRQAFLDAVLAARDRLILSYVGRSQKDNAARAPSVVLDAFLDTCRRTFGPDGLGQIVTQHRLQPSDADYFDPAASAALFTYDARQQPAPDARPASGRFFDDAEPDAEPDAHDACVETTLDELRRAWRSPCRYHCDHLGLGLRLEEAGLADDEPVDLDALGRFHAKSDVLAGVVGGHAEADVLERLALSGRMPPGEIGDALAREVVLAAGDLATRIRAHGDTEAVPVAVDGPGGAWRVEGVLTLSPEHGVLRARPAKVKGKDLLGGWIDHLALCASGLDAPRRTVVAGEDAAWAFEAIEPEPARLLLQFLVRGMLAFRQIPPPLFEKASYAYADWFRDKKKSGWLAAQRDLILGMEERGFHPVRLGRMTVDFPKDEPNAYALKAARRKYDGTFEDFSDLKTDAAVALCYRQRNPFDDAPGAFDRWARMLWGPLFSSAAPIP